VRPASPEIDAVLEPLREGVDRVDRELADNRAYLEERRRRGIDVETRDLLDRAAHSPSAPSSVRRLSRELAAGRLTWDDVFAHRAGADGEAFLACAFRTARERFADVEVAPVRVPDEALAVGVDPGAVDADMARTIAEARQEHDAIFRRAIDGPAR
jgi:hypothetical protein